MWIANSSTGLLVNTLHIQRIFVLPAPDSALLSAVFPGDAKPITLERYKDKKEALNASAQIAQCIRYGDDSVMDLPVSCYYAEERQVKDARTRRRGGS